MNNTQQRVLVVEDEPKLAALLIDYLAAAGYATQWIADGAAVLEQVRKSRPDLMLLDLMLPGRDGIEICRELRTFSDLPVIMLTARVEEIDRLLGLSVDADDYICKPFSPREVVARVRTILRRTRPASAPGASIPLVIDEAGHRIELRGKWLDLTPIEFKLLAILLRTPGRVYSRSQLLDLLHNDHRAVTDRAVDSHIRNLRRKLQEADSSQELIRSIYGVGYKAEP